MGAGIPWMSYTASKFGWSHVPSFNSLTKKVKKKSNLNFKEFKSKTVIGFYLEKQLSFYYWFNNEIYQFQLDFRYNTYFVKKNKMIFSKIEEEHLYNHLLFIKNTYKNKLIWVNDINDLEKIFNLNYNYCKTKDTKFNEFTFTLKTKPDSLIKYVNMILKMKSFISF